MTERGWNTHGSPKHCPCDQACLPGRFSPSGLSRSNSEWDGRCPARKTGPHDDASPEIWVKAPINQGKQERPRNNLDCPHRSCTMRCKANLRTRSMQLGRRFPIAILSSSLVTLADELGRGEGGCRSIRVQDSNCVSSLSCKPHACGYASWERMERGGGVVAYAGAKRLQAETTKTNDNHHHHHLHDTLAAFRQFPCPPHRAGSPRASSTTHTSPPLLMPDAHSEPPVDDVRRDILLQLLPGKSFRSPF